MMARFWCCKDPFSPHYLKKEKKNAVRVGGAPLDPRMHELLCTVVSPRADRLQGTCLFHLSDFTNYF